MESEEQISRGAGVDDAISHIRNGESNEFEVVVRRFEMPLRAWVAMHATPGIDVDEVFQRTMVEAFKHLDEYLLGTNFAAWLFTIARFQLQGEMTRMRRIADYHSRLAPEFLRRELERRIEAATEMDTRRLAYLKECLGKVGEHLRRFVTWRYEEEISLQEMAVRSGRSVPAVKKQLWKLRRTLQECIESRMASEDLRYE